MDLLTYVGVKAKWAAPCVPDEISERTVWLAEWLATCMREYSDGANESVGIPNVPAIIHHEQMKRDRAKLDVGICPRHGYLMEDDEQGEYCPLCEEEESL